MARRRDSQQRGGMTSILLLRVIILASFVLGLAGIRPASGLRSLIPVARAGSGPAPTNLVVSFSTPANSPCAVGAGTLDGNGVTSASVSITGVGQCQITATQSGTSQFNPADPVSQSFTINPVVTTLSVGAIASTPYHDTVSLSATVSPTSVLSTMLSGTVTFAIDGQPVSPAATVNPTTGMATASPVVTQTPGPHSVTASFTSTSPAFASAQTTGNGTSFHVSKEDTTVAITGVTELAQGSSPTVSAILKEDGTTPINGKTVQIMLGSGSSATSCTGVTGNNGIASCRLPPISVPIGAVPMSATFPVPGQTDSDYLSSASASQLATIYGYLPQSTGAYTLGDLTAQHDVGTTTLATFWGPRWASMNQLSGGAAPPTFFGLAKQLARFPPVCGTTWTSTIAQSITPPRNLPPFVGMVMTSHVTRSGNILSGTVVGIAVVQPTPALGAGFVVATFCPASGSSSLTLTRRIAAGARTTTQRRRQQATSRTASSRAGQRRSTATTHRIPRQRTWHGMQVFKDQISKQNQSIQFGSLGDHHFGDQPFTITAESILTSLPSLIPPDPSTVAPPTNPTVATQLFSATAFLYTGSHPIQTGVTPGAISQTRVSVLRGTVNNQTGTPLPGVTITVLGHPEYGQTISRQDGGYDLAVNGGGALTLTYTLNGYLPAQRQVTPSWDDYAQVDPVDLVPFDTHATTLSFSGSTTSFQVAQGSSQSDASGSRQETVLAPPGETATMTMPNGSSQPLTSGTLRLTEFTAGANGPDRMPATLPAASAYTYCFSFSLDEALLAGATGIALSKPLIAYNQNFLNWPVGALVPIGGYSQNSGQWAAQPNGLVIKILDHSGPSGEADLVVDSSGLPATTAEYQGLGITDSERTQLATMYPIGASLWRFTFGGGASTTARDAFRRDTGGGGGSPLPSPTYFDPNGGTTSIHLTNADQAGVDALSPPNPNTSNQDLQQSNGQGNLDLQRQTMSEDRVVSGTPYTLHYASDRQNGFAAANTLHIPIPGDGDPNLKEIDVHLQVAGRDLVSIDTSIPGSVTACCVTITWDGKDAYGRPVNGEVPATVALDYISVLPFEQLGLFLRPLIGSQARMARRSTARRVAVTAVARSTTDQRHPAGQGPRLRDQQTCVNCRSFLGAPLFGLSPAAAGLNAVEAAGHIGQLATRQISYATRVGHFDARADGLGGWTLSAHHTYEPTDQRLNLGDGTTISAQNLTQVIGRIAGTGTEGDSGDGGPALQAQIEAGTGTAGRPAVMAAGPDGSVYFANWGPTAETIRKIAPNGIITTIAGGGPGFFANPNGVADPTCATDVLGDGCQATDAVLYDSQGIAVGPDGSIYLTDRSFGAVRKITPDGVIHLIGGTVLANCLIICGTLGYTGDGVPAIGASLNGPHGIAVAPDGTVYIADTFNNRIRSITTDGLINTLINVGNDGLGPIATGSDGSVYYVQSFDNIYRVDPSGTVSNVTGGSTGIPVIGNAGVNGLSVDQYGDVFFDHDPIGSICDNHIFEITPDGVEHDLAGSRYHFVGSCPPQGDGGAATQAIIASGAMTVTPDGGIFESDGPTIRKVSAPLPGVGRQGYLVPSPDGSELYSFDGSGKQQQTFDALTGAVLLTFGYDSTTGFLTSITDANGNVTTIQHDANGAPTSITAPFGQVTTLTTDANGYLASISDPLHQTTGLATTSNGLLTAITGPNGNTFTQSYNDLGRLTATTDPGGGGWTLSGGEDTIIGTNGNLQTSYGVNATSAGGRSSALSNTTLDDGSQLVQTSLPDGSKHMRALTVSLNNGVTDQAGNKTSTELTADPRLGIVAPLAGSETLTTPSGITLTSSTSRQVTLADPTNPLSLTAQTTTSAINGAQFTQTYTANSTAGSGGTVVDASPLGRTVTTTVDGQDRPTSSQAGNLAPVTDAYDSRGRLASETWGTGNVARTTSYSYGADGRLASVTDPTGRVTSFTYDVAGHLLTESIPGQGTMRSTYDANGNLTSLTTPAGKTWRYQYNGDDLLTAVTPPAGGAGSPTITTSYNADRQVTGVTRSDGQNLSDSYNGATGQLTGTTIPQGSFAYTYSSTTGLPTGVTAPGGVVTHYSYDGSLPTGTTWTGPVTGSVSRGYDSFFRPASDTVAGGTTVSYSYDNDGLLTAAGQLSLTHDPTNGLVTGTTLGSVSTTAGYDGFGEVASVTATANSSQRFGQTDTRDTLGRITSTTESIGGTSHTFTYSYDPQTGRLTQVQKDGTPVEAYSYDTDGNRLTGPGVSTPASYDAQGELTAYGSTTYSYDVAGNRTSKTDNSGATSYVYDPLGSLRTVTLPNSTTIAYLVDGLGQRVGKELNGTLVAGYLYDQAGRIIALLDGNNAVRSQFVYAGGATTPSSLLTGGVEYRIISDQTGSPRLVVNSGTGQVMEQIDYDSFGTATISHVAGGWDPTLLPFGFGGGLSDSDTGLIHLGARDYDPHTGAWTSRDPLGFSAGDTTLYSYAQDDPINLADPSGLGPNPDRTYDDINNLPRRHTIEVTRTVPNLIFPNTPLEQPNPFDPYHTETTRQLESVQDYLSEVRSYESSRHNQNSAPSQPSPATPNDQPSSSPPDKPAIPNGILSGTSSGNPGPVAESGSLATGGAV